MRCKSLSFTLMSRCISIGIAGLLAGCASATPATQAVVPPTWCLPPYSAIPAPLRGEALGEATVSEIGNYIEGQIILAGLAGDIENVADNFDLTLAASTGPEPDDGAPLIPAENGPFADLTSEWRIANDLQYGNFEYRLYTFDPTTDVHSLILEIYRDQQEQDYFGNQIRVFADPNYLVTSPSSDLPVMRGSPWGVEISPWGVEISAPPGTATQGAALQEVFWSQWALHGDSGGINLLTRSDPYGRPEGVGMGEGIDIAVFDTSPYEPGFYELDTYQGQLSLELCISHITPIVSLPPPPLAVASDINNHGLFVAGLAHAVAPSSRISLVKVLDESAQGPLFTLIHGLEWYVAGHTGQAPNSSGTLDHTVINLSLGFIPDPTDPFPHASQVIFWNATHLGAVMVAAAGNHSAGISPPLDPEYPAAWQEVIGAGASNQSGGQSCYANNSDDVYAPGGEGAPGATLPCVPGWLQCAPNDPDCEFGVISLVSNGKMPPGVSYAFWAGSSFSTPMVSGLAALLLEAGILPDQVLGQMTSYARSGTQVIDVDATLP